VFSKLVDPLRSENVCPIVLSPHFDDAVLSCWSVLREQRAVTVVNVFGGVPSANVPISWWDRLTGGRSASERALERRQEDAKALERIGCRPINLPFLGSEYRRGDQDAGPLLSVISPHVDRRTTVYAPAGIGQHPDHFAVRAAAVALLARGVPVTLYAELPYCCHYGWPHWVHGGKEPDPYLNITSDWERSLRHAEIMVAPDAALIRELSPEEQEAKLAAVRTYRTQYSGIARLLAPDDALRFEVFWPLDSATPTRLQSLRHELLWRLGVRRGSRLDLLFRRRALGRLRPKADSRLGQLLRSQGKG
jgi:LmbE family N-acetylglucosaminyl deacetylase